MIVILFRRHLEAIAPGARKFALPTGAVLGWIAWELSRAATPPLFGFAMALMVITFGGASFVMGALDVRARAKRMTRQALFDEARICVSWVGLGVACGIHALRFFA